MRIDELPEIAFGGAGAVGGDGRGIRLGYGEQPIVQADFSLDGVHGADPVDGTLDLFPGIRPTRARIEVGRAAEFRHLARGVLDHFVALDDARVLEADFAARAQAEVLRRWNLPEVIALDVDFAGEQHLADTRGRVFRIVHRVDLDHFARGEIGQHDLDRIEHREAAEGFLVQLVADGVFEHGHVGQAVELGHADVVGEPPHRGGRHAAAAQTGDGRHARVIPAGDNFLLHELHQLALAHHRVTDVEPGELVLVGQGARQFEGFEQPVVQRAVHLELQRADAVGNALDVITQAVREVVHRVDAPPAAGVVMLGVADPVEHRVAQPDIGRRHVDLRA